MLKIEIKWLEERLNCKECKKSFTPITSRNIFCSGKCCRDHNTFRNCRKCGIGKPNTKRVCVKCSGYFDKRKSQVSKAKRR